MEKSMKIVFIGVVVVLISVLFSQAAPPPGAHPDLQVVSLTFVTESYTSDGKTCYAVKPKFSVSNKGNASSGAFHIKMEWNLPGFWQVYSEFKVDSLAPGKTYTREPGGAESTGWCPGRPAVGWRITADSKSEVTESKEGNNTATAKFPRLSHKPNAVLPKKIN